MDFQDLSVEELTNGFKETQQSYHCLFCEAQFSKDEVYPKDDKFYTAKGLMKVHIAEVHESSFHALIKLDKKTTGLSDVQVEMLNYFYIGTPDEQIIKETNITSVSTIRQHRFKLREKEKQAKVFLALMEQLKNPQTYEIHKGAKQVDERYGIEQAEREKVLATYFKDGLDQGIDTIPSKEKKKLIILQHICNRFDESAIYTEKEVNEILKTVNADFVSLRRHLIEYGFMERNNEGSKYWLKK